MASASVIQTGFDSGSTLDYVYRNEPRGRGAHRSMIDATYLGSIGWRGIRARKPHVEEMLREAMRRLAGSRQCRAHRGHRRRPRPLRAGGAG